MRSVFANTKKSHITFSVILFVGKESPVKLQGLKDEVVCEYNLNIVFEEQVVV